MPELDVTWGRVLSIWWLIVWRGGRTGYKRYLVLQRVAHLGPLGDRGRADGAGKAIRRIPLCALAAMRGKSSVILPLDPGLRIEVQTIHRRSEPAIVPWLPTLAALRAK